MLKKLTYFFALIAIVGSFVDSIMLGAIALVGLVTCMTFLPENTQGEQ